MNSPDTAPGPRACERPRPLPERGADPSARAIPRSPAGRLDLQSRDYLALSSELAVAHAATTLTLDMATTAAPERRRRGAKVQEALARELAAHLGHDTCFLFGDEVSALVAVFQALMGPKDVLILPEGLKGPLRDAHWAAASLRRFIAFGDLSACERAVNEAEAAGAHRIVVALEGCGDGFEVPALDLLELALVRGLVLVVDDSEALALAGGRIRPPPCADHIVVVGSLARGLAVESGAFVAATGRLAEDLRREGVGDVVAPPAVCASARAALSVCGGPEGDRRRAHVRTLAQRFRVQMLRAQFDVEGAEHPTTRVILETPGAAWAIADRLRERSIVVDRAGCAPGDGAAELRVTFGAAHGERDVDRAVLAFVEAGRAARPA